MSCFVQLGRKLGRNFPSDSNRSHAPDGSTMVPPVSRTDAPPVSPSATAGRLTRENYVAIAYGNTPPEEWTPELESELPEEIRHWTQFEG
jgi:hypothetical protein